MLKIKRKVAVLLAAYNGLSWINEQVSSILAQEGVDVSIFISVDLSTDSTYEYCLGLTKVYQNIYLLPYGEKFGGAARNFYRLIRDVNLDDFDFVSFADQDDIWKIDKLSHAICYLDGFDAYSSNVIAFWDNGRQVLIDKAQKQVKYDFLFEAAGPGCTYVFSKELILNFREFMLNHFNEVNNIESHDWLIYAYARSNDYKWFIDPKPSMYYRQHSSNQVGANVTFLAAWKRIVLIKSKWYRKEIVKIASLLGFLSDEFFKQVITDSAMGRLRLAFTTHKMRRRYKDKIALSLICFLGLF